METTGTSVIVDNFVGGDLYSLFVHIYIICLAEIYCRLLPRGFTARFANGTQRV